MFVSFRFNEIIFSFIGYDIEKNIYHLNDNPYLFLKVHLLVILVKEDEIFWDVWSAAF